MRPNKRAVRILTPTPNPRFPQKEFLSGTRSRTEILTKESLVRQKTASVAVSRTFTPLLRGVRFSLLRIYFSEPDSDGKSTDLGLGVETTEGDRPAVLYFRVVLANVLSSRFFGVRRSVFLYLVLVCGTFGPFFVPSFRIGGPGDTRQNHPFGNHPFANPRASGASNHLSKGYGENETL